MASSMLTGDRRWGQTRKSGMTVLGKVPKPINLPSQRLENHGLDPNVEIVPKGTLTWGNRPSLTTSNAWGSSSLSSPNADGSSASPSCLSGRPSSGGSYTRPSTSASDRSHKVVSSAWGPNSRPSSASGILLSNQTSAAVTRPRSADTRPGSSQFSCFPDPITESAAWGATRTAEKLVSASKPNNFTLSSGDFPTLGSEKNLKSNVAQQGHSSQGRPASASGRVCAQKETMEPTPTVPVGEPTQPGNQTIVQLDKGNVNTWRRENSPYVGSAVPPSGGNWHRDQQQMQSYPHANVPSQQFDSWLGHPMQSGPDGIWYRGGPPGGVCRPGGPAGSYPVESYMYYPHLPASPLSNSQAGTRHGAVTGGYGPTNGMPYHPHTADSYMMSNHPVGPVRPEIYPRPMHYESYCDPPPNLGSDNACVGPVSGMTPFSSLSDQHMNQNLKVDSRKFHAVPCYSSSSVANELAENDHARESNGPQYKVLLKQHGGSKDNCLERKKDQCTTNCVTQLELGDSRPAQKKGSEEPGGVIPQPARDSEIQFSVPTLHENDAISTKSETVDDHCASPSKKGDDPQRYSVKRSSALIEKIETLNNKARLADSRSVIPTFVGEEKNKQSRNNTKIKVDPTKEANTDTTLPEKSSVEKVSCESDAENKDDSGASNTSASGLLGPSDVGLAAQSTHKRVHSKQGRADHHAKSRFNGQDVEEWRKKSPGRDPTKEANTDTMLPEKSSIEKVSCESDAENKDDSGASNTSAAGLLGPSDVGLAAQSTHKRVHSKQGRADHHAKSRFNGQDVEEWRKKSPGRDPTKEANTDTMLPEKSSVEKVSCESDTENKDDSGASNTSAAGLLGPSDVGLAAQSTRKRVDSKQGRADHHAKSRFNGQDVEEWRKKSPGRDSSVVDSIENRPVLKVQDYQPYQDASEKKEFHHMKVGDEKYSVSSMDPADYKAQHDRMKEIARQRAKQLQKEEEERIREQKARALAKLEELNRRTLAEGSNQILHPPPSFETQSGEDARTCPDAKTNTTASEDQDGKSTSANAVAQKADRINTPGVPDAALQQNEGIISEGLIDSSPPTVSQLVTQNDPSMSQMQDDIKREGKTDPRFRDNTASKQKQLPRKRQENCSEEKYVSENVSIGVMVGSIIVGSKNLGESAPPSSSIGDGINRINKDVDGALMQPKKRNNRTTRNKTRLDEVTLSSAEKVCEDVNSERCKSKLSESVVEDTPILSEASNETGGFQKSSDAACASPNQGSSEGTTGAPSKSTVQWKPQPPKRVTRNAQTTKTTDKFHATEAVVWAPVRLTNKEPPEEVHKVVTEKANPDSSGKNGNDVELNLKSKRAEMERYVPKPVAKEFLQQENLQQPSSPSHHQAASGSKGELGSQGAADGGLDRSAIVKMEVPANTQNGESSRPNRHGRAHTSWRRRGPPESSSTLSSLLEGSSSFDSTKDTHKASHLQQPPKHDGSHNEEPKVSDDGWNDDSNYLMQCEPNTVEKDHAKMNPGRRQPFKGNKVIGNSCISRDNWEPAHGRTNKAMGQMMTMEADESAGRKSARNENQGASGHLRSQWQPKSQACSTPNHCQETMELGVQRTASQGNRFSKETSLIGEGNHNQPAESKSVSTAVTVSAETRNARHHEVKRERRVREESFTRQSPNPNQESSTVPELVPQHAEAQHEPASSGTRRNGERSGWLARVNETNFGGDSGLGPDTGKHNLNANVDRRKHYQRTGYFAKQGDLFQHSSAVGEEAQNISKSMGKYRERGHNHPRRGERFYSQSRSGDA